MDPLSALMQRYCFAYTATHDFSVADQILADDYVFQMGAHVFTGREEAYKPAAERQFRQYPGLGFTVHDFISNGDRCAMYFSEHGYSDIYHGYTAWHGVSLYRWNGERLTECRIEQDYYSRRRQLDSKMPDPIDAPAYSPWTGPNDAPSTSHEQLVSSWLKDGGLLTSDPGSLDDERVAPSVARIQISNQQTEVLDIMSSGSRVAFQARISGNYAGGLTELAGREGDAGALYATGIVDTDKGSITRVRCVSDRMTFERRLLEAAGKT